MVFKPSTRPPAGMLQRLMSSNTKYRCVNDIRREHGGSYMFSYRAGEVVALMADLGVESTPKDVRDEMLAISISINGRNARVFELEKGRLRGRTEYWDAFYATHLSTLSELEKLLYGRPPDR